MKTRSSKYPIGKLLIETLSASALSIHYFSLAIGYGNSNKGVRAFDQMLGWGVPDKVFLDRLQSSSLAIPAETLALALAQSEAIVAEETRLWRLAQIEEERKAFRPYVQAVPEYSTPISITFHGLTGGSRRYTHQLPEEFPTWDPTKQHRHLKELILTQYAAADGKTLFMGRITTYRLFRRYGEQAELLSVSGEPLGAVSNTPLPEATATLVGKSGDAGDLTQIIKVRDGSSE